ncbi:Uncharacterised protein [Pseudomonas aeruginosa]|nr:Uncharacterised protein [Pseudomonas aeruginosa]
MRLAVATALEPGAIFTARPVAVIWLTRETKPYSLWPNSTRATSRRRIAPPSARMRSGISPNCSGVTRVSSTFTVALIGAESGTPRLPMSPTVRRALCRRTALTRSLALRFIEVSLAGSGQMRMAYSAPQVSTLPTPSTRRSACNTLDEAISPSSMAS